MRTIRKIISIFIIVGIVLPSLAEPVVKYDWDKLFAGQIFVEAIKRDKLFGIYYVFTLQASRQYVYGMITNSSLIEQIHSDVDKIDVLMDTPEHAVIQYWITILFTQYTYTLDLRYDPKAYRISWTKTAGDLKQITGYWEIYPTSRPDTTLLVSESFLETDFLLPEWLETWVKMIKSKDIALDYRKWIKKHP